MSVRITQSKEDLFHFTERLNDDELMQKRTEAAENLIAGAKLYRKLFKQAERDLYDHNIYVQEEKRRSKKRTQIALQNILGGHGTEADYVHHPELFQLLNESPTSLEDEVTLPGMMELTHDRDSDVSADSSGSTSGGDSTLKCSEDSEDSEDEEDDAVESRIKQKTCKRKA